jgi:hypothetical protein
MEVIFVGLGFVIFAVGVFLLSRTKTGKKFLDEK